MIMPLSALIQRAPLPTAPELIRLSQKAYDSVRTFEQDVRGGSAGYSGTAHVSFSRPGKLRVSGTTGFRTPYDLLSDGRTTWLLNNGAWSKVKGVESGIASITGVSAQAGTLAPAMLLHTAWGSLNPLVAQSWTVEAETAGGRRLLRVEGKTPFPSKTWFDAATHFVVKTEQIVMDRTMTVSFSAPKVDRPIPESRFRR